MLKYKIPQIVTLTQIIPAKNLLSQTMESTPKACGDKTGRKKTLNHTAGKG